MPTSEIAGLPKPDKQIGIFYFLWLPGARSDTYGPFDNTKIIAADPAALDKPDSKLWGPLHSFHHWGEPLFGYYRIFDNYVLRKHAQMLADAGVDTVWFDTTNSYNYFDQVDELAKVWTELQSRGQKVPKIVFTCRAGDTEKVSKQINVIYDTIYKAKKYESLWFKWQGKPLIVGSPDAPGIEDEAKSFFTFRKLLWPGKPLTPAMWSLDNSLPYSDGNDRLGVDENGKLEEMAAATAVSNAGGPMSRGSPFNSRAWRGRTKGGHLDEAADAVARGGQFQDEWDFVHSHDPKFVLIYCWNEWLAQKFVDEKTKKVFIVDQFSQSHSKDIEPMAGGHGDNYYWQMVANIRKFKGVRAIEPVKSAAITIDGSFEDWSPVSPEFRDTLGDPAKRDSDAFGKAAGRYVNATGRNDLKLAKVSRDASSIYFLIRTADKLTAAEDGDWMTLYIDADHDASTGWLGYDLRVSPKSSGVDHFVEGEWKPFADAKVAIAADGIELSLPRTLITGDTFDFKWTDNCQEKNDWTDFTVNGDAAPNDRYNYRALFR